MVFAGMCGCSEALYPAGLKSEDAGTRIRAIKMAGDRRDRSVMPLLVDRLEDEDDAVRLYAIVALERITGTRLGYSYAKPAPERARAVMRWRNYLQDRGGAATQPVAATRASP
jgi:HEAT repeat protein